VTATPGTGHTLLEKGKGHEPSPRDPWCDAMAPVLPRGYAPRPSFSPFPAPWRASPSGPMTWRGDHRGPRNGGPGERGHADLDRDSHEASTRLPGQHQPVLLPGDGTRISPGQPGSRLEKSFAGRALRDGGTKIPSRDFPGGACDHEVSCGSRVDNGARAGAAGPTSKGRIFIAGGTNRPDACRPEPPAREPQSPLEGAPAAVQRLAKPGTPR